MAAIVPTEGLDYLVGFITGDTASVPTNLYLGLLSDSAGAGTTVPAATATLAAFGGTFSETSYTSYARVAVPVADWGAIGAKTAWDTTGRGSTATQKSFAAAGAADLAQDIVGFFLCTVSTGTSGKVVFFSNFENEASDVIATLALGDIVRVTPTIAIADPATA